MKDRKKGRGVVVGGGGGGKGKREVKEIDKDEGEEIRKTKK